MATPATVNPFNHYVGLDGLPLENGYIWFGEPFQDPEIAPLAAYWDDANTQPAAQPIRTTAGYPARNGAPAMVFVGAQYSMRVRDRNGRQVFYAPNVTAVDLGGGGLDVITASGGQTIVTLVNAAYTPGANALDVYLNGIRLVSGQDYFETGTNQITMAAALSAGDQVIAFARSTFGLTQAVLSDWQAQVFNGAGGGSQNFVLTRSPGAIANLDVSVTSGGIGSTLRPLIDYTLSGNTVTITPAPAVGTNNVLIRYGRSLPQDALRGELADPTSASNGPAMIGFGGTVAYASGVGALLYRTFGRTAAEIAAGVTPTNYAYQPSDPRRYGAVGDWNGTTGTNDTAAFQLAVNATPEGGRVPILMPYKLDTTVTINKPLTIWQPSAGSPYNSSIKPGVYPVAGVAAFTLVARTQNYAFGQYGIVGVHFENVYCPAGSVTSKFITVDKTVNGGDFHIRECSVDKCIWSGHAIGVEFTGIAYLNSFSHNCGFGNVLAVKIERGTASDNGGQTRFYGGYYGLNTDGISLNIDTAGGDFGFHGVTISENTGKGLIVDEECNLYVSPDCQFESNGTCGVYVEIAEAKPNVSGQKRVGGKFITNGNDIWINKTTTAFAGGGFHFPFKIDDAYLSAALSLRVDVPAGHAPIDSPAFIIGRNTSGPSGPVAASQISANFAGTDERKQPYSKRISIPTSYVSGTVFAYLPAGLVVTSARMYFTANCSGFSSISLGDQASAGRYLSGINGQTVTLNTFQVATLAVPQVVIDTTNNAVRIAGSGGWLTAAAVVEIEGYTT